MSQENVDRLRRTVEAWSRGDRQTVEALVRDFLAPGFEMRPLYLDKVYSGAEGLGHVGRCASDLGGLPLRA